MKCTSCGADVQAEARFCHKCGERVDMTAENSGGAGDDPGRRASENPAERFRNLAPGGDVGSASDDEVLWEGTFASQAMIGVWIVAGVATMALLALALGVGGVWWRILWIGTPLLWAVCYLRLLYNQWSVRYTLTSKRFRHEHGLLGRTTDRIEVIDMDDVIVVQTLVDRMTNCGSIKILSSDRSHPEILLRGIADANAVALQIDNVRRAERERRGLHIESI